MSRKKPLLISTRGIPPSLPRRANLRVSFPSAIVQLSKSPTHCCRLGMKNSPEYSWNSSIHAEKIKPQHLTLTCMYLGWRTVLTAKWRYTSQERNPVLHGAVVYILIRTTSRRRVSSSTARPLLAALLAGRGTYTYRTPVGETRCRAGARDTRKKKTSCHSMTLRSDYSLYIHLHTGRWF